MKKTKKRRYYSFSTRVSMSLFLFIVFLFLGIVGLMNSFNIEEEKIIKYSEKSDLDYKVYLKENNFYETEYLGKGMKYIASLIDKINIDFKYDFEVEKKIDLNFKYEILGKLVITDEKKEDIYYEKVYTLLDKKEETLEKENKKTIMETLEIDYEKYNDIANDFKTSYGVNTFSMLVVYFNISKNENNENILVNNETSSMTLNIPLSQKAININMEYKDINNQSSVVDNTQIMVTNQFGLILSILFICSSICFALKLLKLLKKLKNKKDLYDKYISKILREYDRLIVETTTSPFTNETKVIRVKKFTELLDVRDNTKEPIMYYVVSKHQKCYFYINHNEKTYLTTIKRVDLEVEDDD